MNNQPSVTSSQRARALWTIAPGEAELRNSSLDLPQEGEVMVRALFGAISRGTESLVFAGAVPAAMVSAMRCPNQEGELSLPVKYGYCSVGEVIQGASEFLGKRVFCLHPHQDVYVVPKTAVSVIPDEVPSSRAVLAANMETAINALWDAEPTIGSRVTVIGAGAVGLLVSRLVSQIPGVDLEVVDTNSDKDALGLLLGVRCLRPGQASPDRDLVIHATGNGAGLQTALDLAGTEATVVELSWYGTQPVTLQLGGPFHNRRLKIVSSQVGTVAPRMRPRWSYARRMSLALDLLKDNALDALLSAPTAFEQLPQALPSLFSTPGSTVTHLIDYLAPESARD